MDMTLALLRKKRVWFGLVVASCLVAIISHLPIGEWISGAHYWMAGLGTFALPAFVAIYVLAAIFGLPNIVLILAAGTLFGLTEGVISASIADTLSIAACFVIGQTVGRRWITSTVKDNSRFHKLDSAFSEKGWKLVLLTRLSPVLPSNILNYGFSLTRINVWEYLFFSWLGMLPVIFTYVYVGTFGASILSPDQQGENIVFQAIGLAATVGVLFYTTKLTASVLNTDDAPSLATQPAYVPQAPRIASSMTGTNREQRMSFNHQIKRQQPAEPRLFRRNDRRRTRNLKQRQAIVPASVLALPKSPVKR